MTEEEKKKELLRDSEKLPKITKERNEKKIYFIAGLPRSGSTLLVNILAQNPRFGVCATSGLIDAMMQHRNNHDNNPWHRAMPRDSCEQIKVNLMHGCFENYHRHIEKPVVWDKNRGWLAHIETIKAVWDPDPKIVVCTRDLRNVCASFEKLFNKTAATKQPPTELAGWFAVRTALGRLERLIAPDQMIGSAYNMMLDAVTRGYRGNLLFVDFDRLTKQPEKTMAEIYSFTGEEPYEHDFDHVEQVTQEDDFIHVWDELHTIKGKVEPVATNYTNVYDTSVFDAPNNGSWRMLGEMQKFLEKQCL